MLKRLMSFSLLLSLLLILTACITITDPEEEAAKQEELEKEKAEKEAIIAKEEEEKELARKQAETLKKEEEAKKKKEEVERSISEYTKEDEISLNEGFEWVMTESQGIVTNIAPLHEDNYDIIYATVVEEVKLLSESEKQYLVDDLGSSIVNQTIANLYGGDRTNTPHVYFKYADGSSLADPGFLGEGWKVKK